MRGLRKLSRRSFLGTVAGGATVGPLGLINGRAEAAQQRQADGVDGSAYSYGDSGRVTQSGPIQPNTTGCSDSDPTDASGRGRNCSGSRTSPSSGAYTGCNDSDPAWFGGDATGYGRNCRRAPSAQEQQAALQRCQTIRNQIWQQQRQLQQHNATSRNWSDAHFNNARQGLTYIQNFYGSASQYGVNPQREAQLLQWLQQLCYSLGLPIPPDAGAAQYILTNGIAEAERARSMRQHLEGSIQANGRRLLDPLCR